MKFEFSRTKVAAVLFAATVFFIAANTAADYFLGSEDKPIPQINADEINTRFLLALKNLGIKDNWILTETGKKKKPHDSLKYNYKIGVAPDLPITVILNELNKNLDSDLLTVSSKEEGINGKTKFLVNSGKALKLSAEFNYDTLLVREKKRGGIILTNAGRLTEVDLLKLLRTPEQFAILLTPAKTVTNLIKKIKDNKKEYVLYLDDNITDLEYKLRSGFPKERTREVLSNLAGKFRDASFIMVDEESDLYNSSIYNFIYDEIMRRKIMLIKKEDSHLLAGGRDEIISDFTTGMHTETDVPKLFLTDAENYFIIQPEVAKMRKIGYKFLNPSLAVKERLTPQ